MDINSVVLGLAAALIIEQGLAECPAIKSNSIFQLICNVTNSSVAALKKVTK